VHEDKNLEILSFVPRITGLSGPQDNR